MSTEDPYPTLDLALRIGELLLSSGAGAADVSVQMQNVCIACGLRGVVASVTFTELQLTYQETQDHPVTVQIRTVTQREIDYGDLTLVDRLVRELVAGRIDRLEARAELARIVSSGHSRNRRAVSAGWGAMGAGVGIMLGAKPIVIVAAFVAAVGIDAIQRYLNRRRYPVFYQQVAGGMLATCIAVAVASTGVSIGPTRIISAGIIMLLAGVSFLASVQDALTGFPLTSGARVLEATLATAGAIAGVSGALKLAQTIGLDLNNLIPSTSIYSSPSVMALGGGIAAAAFAFSSYAPVRALLPVGLVGAVATFVFGVGFDAGLGDAWPAAVAAVLVGLLGYGVAARVQVPTLVVVVSTVVPLLPGLSIYRGLAHLSQGSAGGLVELVNAAVVTLALAAGVLLGEYIAQPLGRESRRLEQRLSGPRLVGPLTVRAARRKRGGDSA